MKTISGVLIEALLTHPGKTFTASEILKQVRGITDQEVKRTTVSAMISGDWTQKKAIVRVTPPEQRRNVEYRLTERAPAIFEAHKVKAIKWAKSRQPRQETVKKAKPPELPVEINSLEVGEAIITKILYMKEEIVDLQHKVTDGIVRHDADIKAFKEKIRGKDCTIRELQADIERLKNAAHRKGRTMPLSELATINGAHR